MRFPVPSGESRRLSRSCSSHARRSPPSPSWPYSPSVLALTPWLELKGEIQGTLVVLIPVMGAIVFAAAHLESIALIVKTLGRIGGRGYILRPEVSVLVMYAGLAGLWAVGFWSIWLAVFRRSREVPSHGL